MRPNLGYSNLYWINVDRRKQEKFVPPVEELPEATPIPNSIIETPEEPTIEVPQALQEPPQTVSIPPLGTNPIMKVEPVMDSPRKEFKPLEMYTVLELRDICRERGIPQAGSKEELIAKIKLSQ